MSTENPLVTGHNYIQRVNQDIPDFEEVLSKSPGINPFDIEDAFDNPITDKDELVKYGYFKSIEQKVHSEHQILDIGQIKVGRRLYTYHHENISGVVQVSGKPILDMNGLPWKVPCTGVVEGQFREKFYLADFGLVPYPDGLWNAYNWLSRKKLPKRKTTKVA